MKRILLIVCLLLLAFGAGLGWLLASESGLQWAYRHASVRLPGLLTIERLQGRLAGTILLTGVDYRQPPYRVAADSIALHWSPASLIGGEIDIVSLDLTSLLVELPAAVDEGVSAPAPIQLPEIGLPLPVKLGRLQIDGLRLLQGSQRHAIERVRLGGQWRQDGLEIETAMVTAADYQADVSGSLSPTGAWPHKLQLDWRLRLPSGAELAGRGNIDGNLEATALTQSVTGALTLDARLDVTQPLGTPGWSLDARLADLDSTRLDPTMAPVSGGFSVSASGDLDSLTARGELRLVTPSTGPVETAFAVERLAFAAGRSGIVFERLSLDSKHGNLEARGWFGWAQALSWSASIRARDINPARFAAEWPGRLDAELDIGGRMVDEAPELSVEIHRLDGQLRDYPIKLAGRAQMSAAGIDLAGIEFASAESILKANGRIADQLALEWSLDSPNLGQFWPGAGGRLSAHGKLAGERGSPRLVARIKAESLSLDDMSIASLDGQLEVDLLDREPYLAPEGRFEFAADARDLLLGDTRINHLQLKGDRQGIGASADTSLGSIAVNLAGTPGNDGWRGRLLEADLALLEYGDWRLKAPAALVISPGQIKLDGACLVQERNATLCASIAGAGADWQIDGDAADVQLAWLRRWLPLDFNTTGAISGSARLRYQATQPLQGEVRLSLTPGSVDLPLDTNRSQGFDFAGGNLYLQLAETGIRASVRLGLRAGESCFGELDLPGASALTLDPKLQLLKGEARCNLANIDVAEAWLAEIDNLHGSAEFDLRLSGTAAQPRVNGSARLNKASFTLPRLQLSIDRLDAEIFSSGLDNLDFRVDAMLAGGQLEVAGQTRLDADAGWPTRVGISGRDLGLAPLLEGHLPEEMRVEGAIVIDGEFALRLPDGVNGRLRLVTEGGAFSYPLVEGEETRWQVEQAVFEANSDADGISASASVKIDDNRLDGSLRLPGAKPGALKPEEQAIVGSIELTVPDLSLVGAWLAEVQQPTGRLQARLDISGTAAAPKYRVGAELADASLLVPRLGLNLKPISATATTSDDGELRLDAGISADQGKLQINGRGNLDGATPWPVVIQISGQNFPAARLAVARIDVSPELTIEIGDHQIDIKGEVRVPYARLRPRDITTADRISADTVVIGEAPSARSWRITSKTRLILGDRVDFFGYGFDGKLGGNLVIDEVPGQPTRGTGEMVIISGRYLAYGQSLEVENGRLLFTGGPIQNPGLDFVAVRRTGEVTAGLRVGGRLQQPELELFSTPAMGQTDALSYLLTGGPLETATSQQGAMMANAALAIGLSGGDRIARSLGDRFGFDDLRVESSATGEQASLVVGRYLSPKLYVSYGVGLIESINTLNLRYRITPSWRIEAESGAEQGADLLYSIER